MMRLTAHGISVSVRQRSGVKMLLDAVDLVAQPGQVLGLIGPNGAGKSTLLRVLAGVQRAQAGEVRFDASPASQIEHRVRARRLAFLPQGGASAWPLSVETLVALGRHPHHAAFGERDADGAAAIERALRETGLLALRTRIVHTLSGGELARVLLARALAVQADALLADEPVAALDPYHQLEVMQILRTRAQAGGTVIVVLHDLALATRFCDRLLLLDGGRVAAEGVPHEVLTDTLLAEVYRVQVRRISADGVSMIVPWQQTGQTDTIGSSRPE